jgi:hypothetical protein
VVGVKRLRVMVATAVVLAAAGAATMAGAGCATGPDVVSPDVMSPDQSAPEGVPAGVVGAAEDAAVAAAEAAGFAVRVVERDGEVYATTQDYRTDRLNLVVDDGVVTAAAVG